jgi:hypothetical protein
MTFHGAGAGGKSRLQTFTGPGAFWQSISCAIQPGNDDESIEFGELIDESPMNLEFLAAIERILEKGGAPKYQKDGSMSRPVAPQSALKQVAVEAGTEAGIYRLSWEETPHSRGYEIQTNENPTQYRHWVSRLKVREASADIALRPGEDRVWLRVRAMTSTGPGPWSDPIPLSSRQGILKRAA